MDNPTPPDAMTTNDPGQVIEHMRREFLGLVADLTPAGTEVLPWATAETLVLVTVIIEHLMGIEILASKKLEQPALVALRTFLFGCIRLEWFAAAENDSVRDSRIVEYQRESVVRETGLIHQVKRTSSTDDKRIPVMEQRMKDREASIQEFKSKAGVAKQSVDDAVIAGKLGRDDVVNLIRFLNQYAHINGIAISAIINEVEIDDETVRAIERHDQPDLRQVVMSGAAMGLSIALGATYFLLGANEERLNQVKKIGQGWQLNVIPKGPRRDKYAAGLAEQDRKAQND